MFKVRLYLENNFKYFFNLYKHNLKYILVKIEIVRCGSLPIIPVAHEAEGGGSSVQSPPLSPQIEIVEINLKFHLATVLPTFLTRVNPLLPIWVLAHVQACLGRYIEDHFK